MAPKAPAVTGRAASSVPSASSQAAAPQLQAPGGGKEAQRLQADEEVLLSLLEEPDEVEPAAVAAAGQPMELSDSEEEDPCKY
jgi:hypothetical protein